MYCGATLSGARPWRQAGQRSLKRIVGRLPPQRWHMDGHSCRSVIHQHRDNLLIYTIGKKKKSSGRILLIHSLEVVLLFESSFVWVEKTKDILHFYIALKLLKISKLWSWAASWRSFCSSMVLAALISFFFFLKAKYSSWSNL